MHTHTHTMHCCTPSIPPSGLLADAFSDAPQSYEALCRKHMDAFMRGLEVRVCVGELG